MPKRKKNDLPPALKVGVEKLSGLSIKNVVVHRNSDKPEELKAIGQGTDIHLANEAWHVVQRRKGNVSATKQLLSTAILNNDKALESEADKMGAQAIHEAGKKKK